MTTIELTQIQANRWDRHLADGRNATGGTRPPASLKRQQDAIRAYQDTGSLGYVCRNLRMGRDTLKSILKTNGVPV